MSHGIVPSFPRGQRRPRELLTAMPWPFTRDEYGARLEQVGRRLGLTDHQGITSSVVSIVGIASLAKGSRARRVLVPASI